MKKKKWLLSLISVLTLFLILSACSEDKKEDETTDTTDEKKPQVLVFGRGGDSVSLDPAIVTDGESFKVTENIFETLLEFGPQDTTIQPGLAKK